MANDWFVDGAPERTDNEEDYFLPAERDEPWPDDYYEEPDLYDGVL